ncbi:hypothetical protein A3709_20520 [Halioglobus sp. HI00S01]|nr:hypothetical protein A3709_20520 [Halioglobus sp. HI00S01]
MRLYEVLTVDGLRLDLLVEARATNFSAIKQFGVVFLDSEPAGDYPIPVLMMTKGQGTWILPRQGG